MKVAIVLPRGMVFSENGATSIDLVVKDQIESTRCSVDSYVLGSKTEKPFTGFDFRSVVGHTQKLLNSGFEEHISMDLPDVIVVHQYPQTAAYLAKKFPAIPVVLYRHGLLRKNRNVLSRLVKQRLFIPLRKIIFVSDFIRESFLNEFPQLSNKCETLFNSVDTTVWRPAVGKLNTISFAGRAREDKGILELVAAFLDLQKKDWTLTLALAVQTEEEKAFLRKLIRYISDEHQIQLRINLKSHEVREVFASSRIACLPSIVKEGFPRAVVEAMSCGCATISTNSGGTPEAVGDAGILLEDANPITIKEALSKLIGQPSDAVLWGARAREHAVSKLDKRSHTTKYLSILDSV
ncbi:glycosyltransferase family 4 protein [Pseudovibrio exalbescens]|uniref:Uncharacterized protein n=1 Tax=Pseudovibrio exalbescens TaxID=197461 RepID=A0A1U7JJ50_9HYPH|nr:glycosyltransferase family 4 protein [Pseudovibrio exalbescens]OKL44773.1 hypothetical protein A3843_06750 [Pseudovibrio exalbescens]